MLVKFPRNCTTPPKLVIFTVGACGMWVNSYFSNKFFSRIKTSTPKFTIIPPQQLKPSTNYTFLTHPLSLSTHHMTARSNLLSGGAISPPPQSAPITVGTLDSDYIVILAALLCALICVLGLVAVARCAWIRRIAGRYPASSNSPAAPPPSAANKGLKKKVLKSLPKLTYGKDNEQAAKLFECAICLAEFATGEEIRILPQCGHGFHVVCIDTWLGCHSSCPSCRQILEVARCQKCGRLPASTCSAAAAQPNHGSTFLPWNSI